MADQDIIIEAYRRGLIDEAKAKSLLAPKETSFAEKASNVAGRTVRAVAEGAGDVAGIIGNPLNLSINKMFGTNLSTDLGQTVSDELTAAGVAKPEGKVAEFADKAAGALVPAAGIGAGLTKLAKNVGPIASSFLSTIQANPSRFLTAEGLAAIGATGGEQIAREIAPDSKVAPVLGSLAGGIGPSAIADISRSLVRGGSGASLRQGIKDADSLGLTGESSPSLGTLSGSSPIQALENTIAKIPGGKRISKAARQAETKLGEVINRRTGSGETSAARAGRTIDRGLFGDEGFFPQFKERSGRLYDLIDETIPPATPASISNTRETLEELTGIIPGLENTSRTLNNPFFQEVADDLAKDAGNALQIPYKGLKSLRTKIGKKLNNNVLAPDVDRAELEQLYGALSRDMEQAATLQGPEALAKFKRANQFYKAGIKRINEQFAIVNRKANPEDVFKTVIAGSGEGATRLNAIKRSLKPEEWKIVVNTVTRRLGKATNSKQDDLGETFSAETFLTNWNRLAPEAKASLYGQFPSYRRDMDTIARMAARLRRARSVNANPSGTGSALANMGVSAVGGGALAAGNAPIGLSLLTGLVANNRSARLLTNPRFARWAAKTVKSTPQRIPAQIARLANIAESDEEIRESLAPVFGGDTEVLEVVREENQ